ncbi:hypothetical protein BASA61_001330 [Batrachochytrium salamandrivorans]|nr:hypothetical protein BASA61_001330 [Batrachochytrium salamandrivorans]
MAMEELIHSIVDHPRVYAALVLLPALSFISPLLYQFSFHLSVVLALAVLFSIWTTLSDIVHNRKDLGRVRDRLGFFQSGLEARQIAVNSGHSIRQFHLCSPARWARINAARKREVMHFKPRQYTHHDQIQQSLNKLVEYITQDFVRSWYTHISTEPAFVSRVEQALHNAFAEIQTRIDRIDVAQILVAKVCPAIVAHALEIRKAETLLRAESIQKKVPESDEFDYQLARYYLNGNLHPAVSTAPTQNMELELAHLRSRIKLFIPLLFQKSEIGSSIFTALVREILVCRIIQPVVAMLSDPDYWNQTFDSLADAIAQHEQSPGRKVGDSLEKDIIMDPGDLESSSSGLSKPPTFDEYVTQIKTCDNLADAIRIRDIISIELQKKKSDISGYDGDDIVHGVKVSKVQGYIRRLDVAKRRVDKRILVLGGRHKKGLRDADAEDILTDSPLLSSLFDDPQLLSYFVEYMEHAGRLHVVQFYIRGLMLLSQLNLSDINSGDLEDTLEMDPLLCTLWDIHSLSDDIQRLFKEYFSKDAPSRISELSPATIKALQGVVDSLAIGDYAFSRDVLIVRGELRYVIQALEEVYRIIDRDDYPGFIWSDFYLRMMAHIVPDVSDTNSTLQTGINSKNGGKAVVPITITVTTEDGSAVQNRISSDSDRSPVGADFAGGSDYGLGDDSLHKSKGRSIIDAVFKGKRKTPIKFFSHSSPMNVSSDDPGTPVPVRIENTANIEGELHSLVNSDENSFVSFIRKKTSRMLGDDRAVASRDEGVKESRSTDLTRHFSRGGREVPIDSIKNSPHDGGSLSNSNHYSSSSQVLHFQPTVASHLGKSESLPDSDYNTTTTSLQIPPQETDSAKGLFSFGPFKRKNKHGEKSDIVSTENIRCDPTNVDFLDTATSNQPQSTSQSEGNPSSYHPSHSSTVASKPHLSDPALREGSTKSITPPSVSSDDNISKVPASSRSTGEFSSLGTTSFGESTTSPLFQQGSKPIDELSFQERKVSLQRHVSPPTLTSASKEDSPVHHFEDTTSGDGHDSDTEFLQSHKLARADDEDIQSWLEESNGIHLTGVPRSPSELALQYPPGQDILPSMIIAPKRILKINQELLRLQADSDDVSLQLEKCEESVQGLKKEDDGLLKQRKQLHYMRIGIDEEIRRLVTEKRSLEMNELDNVIAPGQTTVSIGESYVANEEGKDYVIYPVQVQRSSSEGITSGWVVVRRYSEFLSMHQALRIRYPTIIQQYEMPGKLLNGLMKLKKQSFELRRVSLEKYLQSLLHHMEICKSVEFRKFLCHPSISRLLFHTDTGGHQAKRSFFKSIFHTMDEGIDTFWQRLRTAQHNQAANDIYSDNQHHQPATAFTPSLTGPSSSPSFSHHPVSNPSLLTNKNSTLFGPSTPSFGLDASSHSMNFGLSRIEQGSGVPPTSATDAIIDVFIEIFELKEKNNWLRRQAVVLFLQQLFGGTVERRVNELLRWVVCEENTAYMLTGIIGTFWPKGVWDPQLPTRTIEDKRRSRLAAQGKLATLLPEMLGGVVGRQNAKRGALRWCSLFQNRRLNQHLVYTIMDDLLVTLFPETSN